MREPRPVSLTEHGRRHLRAVEEALDTEEPAPAGLLGQGGPRARRRVGRTAVVIAVVVGVFGLLLADTVLRTDGAMLLLALPPAVWWFARVRARRW